MKHEAFVVLQNLRFFGLLSCRAPFFHLSENHRELLLGHLQIEARNTGGCFGLFHVTEGLLDFGNDPVARACYFRPQTIGIGPGLGNLCADSGSRQQRQLQRDAHLPIIALEPPEEFIVVVEAGQNGIFGYEVCPGQAGRAFAAHLQALGGDLTPVGEFLYWKPTRTG